MNTGSAAVMKVPPTKAELRARLEQEMQQFLRGGGEIERVPTGLSGREPGDPPPRSPVELFSQPKSARTPIPEVIAALEARRRPARKPRHHGRERKPRRKMLYDDFGEPLRLVWEEDTPSR